MSPESGRSDGCDAVRVRLEEALLGRGEPQPADQAHLAECAACAALHEALCAIAAELDAWAAAEPRPELVGETLARAAAELRAPAPLPSAAAVRPAPLAIRPALPRGFGRELARIFVVALAPLPLVLVWNWIVIVSFGQLLAGLVPAPLLGALGVAYALAAASWLAVLYGALPFVAHRRVMRLESEVTP